MFSPQRKILDEKQNIQKIKQAALLEEQTRCREALQAKDLATAPLQQEIDNCRARVNDFNFFFIIWRTPFTYVKKQKSC